MTRKAIQDTMFKESYKVRADTIKISNYYEVLDDEATRKEETNNEIEYDYADTGYEHEDYYNDYQYYKLHSKNKIIIPLSVLN